MIGFGGIDISGSNRTSLETKRLVVFKDFSWDWSLNLILHYIAQSLQTAKKLLTSTESSVRLTVFGNSVQCVHSS